MNQLCRSVRFTLVSILALAPALDPGVGTLLAQDLPSVGTTVRVGPGVYEIAVHERTGDVYAATVGPWDQDQAAIYVLDGSTLEEKGTIPTPGHYPFGVGLDQGASTLYASDTRNGTVLVYDLASMALKTVIENPMDESGHLREVLVDEQGGRVYVSSYDENGLIWVIDSETHRLVDTFMGVGDGTSGMAFDLANDRMFAANMAGGDITEIRLSTGEQVRRFSAGGERPTNLVYDAERGRLWSTNQRTNNATVIDVASGEVIHSVSVGDQALGITHNPVNDLMYVTARRSGIVTAVDAESMNVVTWMQTGSHPNTVAVNPNTGVAYVTNKARSAGRDHPPVRDPHGDTVTLLHR